MLHINKWKNKITKFGNEEIQSNDGDAPKIFFRRDARLTLQTEKMVLTIIVPLKLFNLIYTNFMKIKLS